MAWFIWEHLKTYFPIVREPLCQMNKGMEEAWQALRIGRNVPVVSDLLRAPDFNVRAQSR